MSTILYKEAANSMLKNGEKPSIKNLNGKIYKGFGKFKDNFFGHIGFEFPLPETGTFWEFKEDSIEAVIKTFGIENRYYGTFEALFESNLPMICHLDKEAIYKKIQENNHYLLIDEYYEAEVLIIKTEK